MICGWIQWFNYSHPFVKAYRWVCWEIFSEKAFIFPLVMSIVFFVSSPSCSFNIFVVKSLNRPQISMPPILLKRTEAKWRGFPLPRPMSKNEECSSMLEQSLNNKKAFGTLNMPSYWRVIKIVKSISMFLITNSLVYNFWIQICWVSQLWFNLYNL